METDAVPDVLWRGTARVRTAAGTGAPLPWACAGADALVRLAATLGLRRTGYYRGARSFVRAHGVRAGDRAGLPQRQGELESAARAGVHDGEPAAVRLGEGAGDGQPQPGARAGPGVRAAAPR